MLNDYILHIKVSIFSFYLDKKIYKKDSLI